MAVAYSLAEDRFPSDELRDEQFVSPPTTWRLGHDIQAPRLPSTKEEANDENTVPVSLEHSIVCFSGTVRASRSDEVWSCWLRTLQPPKFATSSAAKSGILVKLGAADARCQSLTSQTAILVICDLCAMTINSTPNSGEINGPALPEQPLKAQSLAEIRIASDRVVAHPHVGNLMGQGLADAIDLIVIAAAGEADELIFEVFKP